MTVEAGKGDNWIQFTEQISNLKDVGSEDGLLAGAMRVVEFGAGDELVFGQHDAAADPRELTGDVLQGMRVDIDVDAMASLRSEEHTSELQSLMRISYAVFCLTKKHNTRYHTKPCQ